MPRLDRHPVGSDTEGRGVKRFDLIVMGTHGLTGADRLLLGSTTMSAVRRWSKIRAPRRRQPGIVAGEPILSPVELDESSSREVESAARLAHWFGASRSSFTSSPVSLP
jgi:nucleotide-binding universal stress UspA family protein